MQIVAITLLLRFILIISSMNETKIDENDEFQQQETIPVLSEYVKSLESHVKQCYLKKIAIVGVDPASIPIE